MKSKEIKLKIIEAGHRAVEQLIKVAKEAIIKHDPEDDLSADRLKNAAATKKLAIFDAFEILSRIEAEREALDLSGTNKKVDTKKLDLNQLPELEQYMLHRVFELNTNFKNYFKSYDFPCGWETATV